MAARRRSTRQPYAWLGAGALTLGVGAALVSGTAVASADTGAPDATAGSDTTAGAPRAAVSARRSAPVRMARPDGAVARPAAATAARQNRIALPVANPAPEAARPAATANQGRASRSVVVPAAAIASSTAAPSPSSTSNATAPVASAPFPNDPPYSVAPFLPTTPIVPGSHVQLSLQEISQAQAALSQATFGSGNLLAGVASVVPQLFLAEAALSLNAWGAVMPVTQRLVAATAGIPVLEQIAQATLLAAMTLPSFAGVGFGGASLFMPVVSALGATTTGVTDLIEQASQDGMVYAIVPVTMKAVTEPTINVKVNDGPATSVLVDTGSSGLLVTRDVVGSANLGPATGTGSVIFSGGADVFDYTAYNATVDFGNGAVTGPTTIFIVDDADAAAYKAFLAPAGVVGILGTGASTFGPDRCIADCGNPGEQVVSDPVPTSVLPGELSDGYLLIQDLFFGLLGGVMILGPNPFPTRVSVPGAGYALLQASVNGGARQAVTSIIDSGGVYGTLPNTLPNVTGSEGSSVPAGTRINVYSPDGQTLLYTYTTGSYGPTIVDGATDPMNTGNIAFSQGPVYVNYGAPGGRGSTDFAIW